MKGGKLDQMNYLNYIEQVREANRKKEKEKSELMQIMKNQMVLIRPMFSTDKTAFHENMKVYEKMDAGVVKLYNEITYNEHCIAIAGEQMLKQAVNKINAELRKQPEKWGGVLTRYKKFNDMIQSVDNNFYIDKSTLHSRLFHSDMYVWIHAIDSEFINNTWENIVHPENCKDYNLINTAEGIEAEAQLIIDGLADIEKIKIELRARLEKLTENGSGRRINIIGEAKRRILV